MANTERHESRLSWLSLSNGDKVLYDRENGDAWVQSSVVVDIGQQ